MERYINLLPLARPLLETWHATPGRCPDWESNQRPFGSQAGTQSPEPHQPGLSACCFKDCDVGIFSKRAIPDVPWYMGLLMLARFSPERGRRVTQVIAEVTLTLTRAVNSSTAFP